MKQKSYFLLTLILGFSLICSNLNAQDQPHPRFDNVNYRPSPHDFVPLPQLVNDIDGYIILEKGLTIVDLTQNPKDKDSNFNSNYLKEKLIKVFDFEIIEEKVAPEKNFILLTINQEPQKFENIEHGDSPEAYSLTVKDGYVHIDGRSKTGLFYGIQTLLQLLPPQVYANITNKHDGAMLKEYYLGNIEVIDAPRFEYRGNMLDVSRSFFDKDFIIRHLDRLAYHKINKFHWHLTDDNGWRIEIKKYPELTRKGAWRGKNEVLEGWFNTGDDSYGGYYTQEEIKEIVKYAADRNIEIIPEIDLPGHSKAVIASYPNVNCKIESEFYSIQGESNNVWCVGNEDNYKMLDNIIKEIVKLFPSEYIHIGGDEVNMVGWEHCEECQALMKREGMTEEIELLNYFVRRLENIVGKYGKKMAGWEEILDGGELKPNTLVTSWHYAGGEKAIEKNQPTVMQVCEYCYFDMKYSDKERGHNWAAIVTLEDAYRFDPIGSFKLTKEQEKLILGPQGALWTEMLFLPPHFSDYQMFPRLCATAEVGWTPQNQREWEAFNNRIHGKHLERMYQMGIKCRIPFPKVEYKGNQLVVESPYPAAVIRYSTDGLSPTIYSPVVTGNIITDAPHKFRFATFYHDIKSATVGAENIDIYQYQTPEVKVTSSMNGIKGWELDKLTDWKQPTAFRSDRRAQEGDWILFEFPQGLNCEKITSYSSDPEVDFYGINKGHVEISYDGVNFENAGEYRYNKAIIENIEKEVKAVKIVIDGINDGRYIIIQDLRIE